MDKRSVAVAVAVVTSSLGVLVGRRVDAVPPWVFVGGKVERGESSATAAVREAREETGLTVVAHAEIGRRVHPRTGRLLIYIACTTADPHAATVMDADELAEVRWVGLTELDGLMPDLYDQVRDHLHREA